VELLLKANALTDLVNDSGMTALEVAAAAGHTECEMLLHGDNPEEKRRARREERRKRTQDRLQRRRNAREGAI
jgi:ankyrin repeat protein